MRCSGARHDAGASGLASLFFAPFGRATGYPLELPL